MAEFLLGRIKFVYQGNWTSTRAYLVDDVVSNGGKTYMCVVNHTSSSLFATDLSAAPTKWNLVADGQTWRNNWIGETYYNVGDIVKYGGLVYICKTAHVSDELALTVDNSKWDIFAKSLNWAGDWTTSSDYKLNDIVSYGSSVYICKTAHTSQSSISSGLEADLAYWDTFNTGIDYLGAWSGSSVRYKVNDVVKYGANLYICSTQHTSSGTAIDLTKFNIFVNGFQYRNAWSSLTSYIAGDIISYGGNNYIAKTNNSNSTPTSNPSDWAVFSTGITYQGDWSDSSTYLIGSLVRNHSYTYLSTVDSPSIAQTVTESSSTNNIFTVASTAGMIAGMGVTFTPATLSTVASATTATGNFITLASTATLAANMPITFVGSGFGNLTPATQYYIRTVPSTAAISVASVTRVSSTVTVVTGTTVQTTTSADTTNTITVVSATGIVTGMNVFGTGIGTNATVQSINGLIITLSTTNTSAVSGVISFVQSVSHGLTSGQTLTVANTSLVDQSDVIITVTASNTFTYTSGSSGAISTTYLVGATATPAPQVVISSSNGGSAFTVTTATGSMVVSAGGEFGGITPGTLYYIHTVVGGSTFKITDTLGGNALTLTSLLGSMSAVVAPQPTNTAYWTKLNSGLQWTNNQQTYTGLSGSNVVGAGSSATFDVTRTGTVYTVTVNSGGSGYVVGNTIKILGTSVGGLTPVNDLLITVATVATGAISTVTSSGISSTWKLGIYYTLGDVATFGANSYICVEAHTSINGNRPDADLSATYWNLLTAGAEVATLTTSGDTLYYGPNGPTRLPVGTNGQVLRSTNGYPTWTNYGQINNIVYVSPTGVDLPAPTYGLTIDTAWNSVRYAAKQIENGYLNPQAQALIVKNKQFIMKEINNYLSYTFKTSITGTAAGAFTCTDTSKLNVNMPFTLGTLTGSLTIGGNAINTSTVYYVKTISANTSFTFAASAGGTALSAGGTGTAVANFSYDNSKAERDAGIVVDAVAYDLSHGGTQKITRATRAYYDAGGASYITVGTEYQLTQFIAAQSYLSTLLVNVLSNTAPSNNYQTLNSVGTTANQIIDTLLTSESGSISTAQSLMSIVVNGLTAGNASSIPVVINPNTTISVKTGTFNEVLPIVLSENVAIVGDELRSTVVQPKSANPLLVNDKAKTVSALTRIKNILPTLISNGSVTPSAGNTQTQVTTLPAGDVGSYSQGTLTATATTSGSPGFVTVADTATLTSGTPVKFASTVGGITGGTTYYVLSVINGTTFSITASSQIGYASTAVTLTSTTGQSVSITIGNSATTSVVANSGTMVTIVDGGLASVPSTYLMPELTGYNTATLTNTAYAATGNVTGNTLNYGSGVKQIIQNRTFILDDAQQYLQNTYASLWTTLGVTGQANSRTNIGYILDAVIYDLMYGGNTQSLIAGSAYYSYTVLQLTPTEQTAFVATFGYLKTTVLANVITATSYGKQVGTPTNQTTTGTGGSTGASNFAQARVQDVIDWINNGSANTTVTPAITVPTSSLQTAYAAVVAKRSEIASDATVWVQKYFQSLSFNIATCQRDAGLITDALAYDLLFGSNFASITAARSYYRGTTSANVVINSQKSAQLGMFNFLAYKVKSVASSGTVATASTIIDDIIGTINGTQLITGYNVQTCGTVTYNNTLGTIKGAEILRANKEFLAHESANWVNANFGGTVTTTATTNNLITTNANHNFVAGDPIKFSATTVNTAAVTTTTSTNLITVGTSANMVVGMPITFSISSINLTATATTVSTDPTRPNYITVSSTTGLTVGMSVIFTGTAFGNIVSGTTYYIASIPSSTYITISSSYLGSVFALTSASGNISGVAGSVFGGITSGVTYYVETVASGTTITISDTYNGSPKSLNSNLANVSVTAGGIFGGVFTGQTYYVLAANLTGTSFAVTDTQNSTTPVSISDANGIATVSYGYDLAYCLRDMREWVDALVYDLQYTGNYKGLRASTIYLNAVNGSISSDMFLVRNGTGLRNMTLNGLTGTLSAANAYGTKRPTAGSYTSLDPGFGPNDSNVWVTTRSCYAQNLTLFGTACTGMKIDGALHAGGNRSIVANDYTTIISDGIGVWCTGANSLTELVSVFNYYGYAGYLAELGGRIRATNGNSSYGTYGVIAEGVDSYETPLYADLNNRGNEAFITNVFTDSVNKILRLEYANAGSAYTNASYTISGSGFNAAAVGDEFRDAAIFETRLVDLNDTNGFGGSSYATASNSAQSGTAGTVTIANADTALSTAYVGMRILITAGTGAGQSAAILAYNNGNKVANIYRESFTNLTITATTNGSPSTVTVSSTATLYANMPFYVGTTVGGLSAGTVYFVKTIVSGSTFSVSATSGGTAFTSEITTTTSQTVTLYAAGWDHVVPGSAIVDSLDLSSTYVIEPRIVLSAPGYTATSRTITSASYADVVWGAGNYVAINASGAVTSYSSDGITWASAGAVTNTTWADLVYGGGQKATATAVVGGLGGSGAVLTANIAGGLVTSITVVNGGAGYTTPPTITITPIGLGGGATAICSVLNGAIASVTVVIQGSGYTVAPTVGVRTDVITSFTINTSGINYSSTPTVVVSGGGSSNQATGTAVLSNSGVLSITVGNSGGTGYTSQPSVSIIDSNAKFVAIPASGGAPANYATVAGLGSTWTVGSGNLPAGSYTSIDFGLIGGSPVWMAVGGTASGAITADGATWTTKALPTLGSGTYSAVAYGNGTFVAISTGSNATAVYSSSSWSAGGTLPVNTTWTSVAYGNGRFVAIASGGTTTAYSLDNGTTWTTAPAGLPAVATWTDVSYGQGLFLAVANGTAAATSPDGINWTARALASSNWKSVAFGNTSNNPLFVAVSSTSGTVSASIRTGATAQARARVISGAISEVRMIEPGSGYPKGTITATTASGSVITTADTTNLIDSQPIEFTGLDAYGLITNTTYYVIGAQIVTNTSFKVSATAGSSTPVTITSGTGLGGTYRAGPILTQTDPNRVRTAAMRVRQGDGALGNPSYSNRGTGNITATANIAGDGYADLYQPSSFINVRNLFAAPVAGANVEFSTIPNVYYKLVTVTNLIGDPGNYTATFQINPSLSVLNAPTNGTLITTRLKYSQVRLTGHDFLYIGTGNAAETNYPFVDTATAIQANQTLGSNGGRVFFTSTDQDGNFNVGNLFGVQQATGTATLNASAFNLSGLQSLSLGSVAVGSGSAVISQFSTDPYFTANSDSVVPTQRAIKSYITAQIGGGQSQLNVNTLTSGVIYVANNSISTTTGVQILVNAKMNFTGGIDGSPVALGYFMQR